jgi:uncharacterized protein YegL
MREELGLIQTMIDTLKQDVKQDLFVIKSILIFAVTLLVLKLGCMLIP